MNEVLLLLRVQGDSKAHRDGLRVLLKGWTSSQQGGGTGDQVHDKKHRRRIILPQHGKDTSDEMKHAAANRDCCRARIHFCGEKGGRVGAAAMGKREEEGHPSDGGRGGDGMLLLWCLREGERRR